MPWKLCDGRENEIYSEMSRLCEEFGISRKTGYKIWNRYQNTGAYALVDRSRKPHRYEPTARTGGTDPGQAKAREAVLGSSQDSGAPDS